MNKIQNIRLLIIVMLGIAPQVAMSQNLNSMEYTVLSEVKSPDSITYEVEDSEGHSIRIITPSEITSIQAEIVQSVARKIHAIPALTIESLKILFEDDRAVIHVMPSSYFIGQTDVEGADGIEVSKYMKSGMQFYFTTALEYNFRMFIENLFVRIQGHFFSSKEFEEKLISAVNNPAAYIQTHDPEFIIRKIATIDATIDELKKVDFNNYESLNAKYNELVANFNNVRFGLMMLNNRGMFGSINTIDQDAIEKLVSLKTADPSLTIKEAEAKMKESSINITKKEIFLVFAIYFNEFE